jgi:hypothetical protein
MVHTDHWIRHPYKGNIFYVIADLFHLLSINVKTLIAALLFTSLYSVHHQNSSAFSELNMIAQA